MISKTNLQIYEQILKTDRVICRHISNMSNLSRGEISQDILAQLRHFLESCKQKSSPEMKKAPQFSQSKNGYSKADRRRIPSPTWIE